MYLAHSMSSRDVTQIEPPISLARKIRELLESWEEQLTREFVLGEEQVEGVGIPVPRQRRGQERSAERYLRFWSEFRAAGNDLGALQELESRLLPNVLPLRPTSRRNPAARPSRLENRACGT